MGQVIIKGAGGNSADSADLTTTAQNVLYGTTYIGADTNDESGTGTMYDNSKMTAVQGGNGNASGISANNKTIPTRQGANLQMATDTNGVSRINIGVPRGFYPDISQSYVNMPSSEFGNASAGNVLYGQKFTSTTGLNVTGTMPNNGAVSKTLNCGDSYTIPTGYHNGSGRVVANSLASQTQSNASAGNILAGRTAYVNGNKITGTMADRGLAQYATNMGQGNDYYAFCNIPEGWYHKDGNSWAPEIRLNKNTVRNYLGVNANNIAAGASIAGIGGTFRGNVACIHAMAARQPGLDAESGEEAGFTLPSSGTVYYGGMAYAYGSSHYESTKKVTLEIWKGGTRIDQRNMPDDNGDWGYGWRGTMFDRSFSANAGERITVKAYSPFGTYVVACIQAVIVYGK